MKATQNTTDTGLLKTVTLDCSKDEMTFLAMFLSGIVSAEVVPDRLAMETYTLIDLYDSKLRKFTILAAGKLKLKPAQFLALERMLMIAPVYDDYSALLRNGIISALNQLGWNKQLASG